MNSIFHLIKKLPKHVTRKIHRTAYDRYTRRTNYWKHQSSSGKTLEKCEKQKDRSATQWVTWTNRFFRWRKIKKNLPSPFITCYNLHLSSLLTQPSPTTLRTRKRFHIQKRIRYRIQNMCSSDRHSRFFFFKCFSLSSDSGRDTQCLLTDTSHTIHYGLHRWNNHSQWLIFRNLRLFAACGRAKLQCIILYRVADPEIAMEVLHFVNQMNYLYFA